MDHVGMRARYPSPILRACSDRYPPCVADTPSHRNAFEAFAVFLSRRRSNVTAWVILSMDGWLCPGGRPAQGVNDTPGRRSVPAGVTRPARARRRTGIGG